MAARVKVPVLSNTTVSTFARASKELKLRTITPCLAMPLQRSGLSRFKGFMYGQFSGMVEPLAGVLGAFAVVAARPLLPYTLAFAAGAMIFVVVEDAIPEAQSGGHNDTATLGAMLGFTLMMILDVALG